MNHVGQRLVPRNSGNVYTFRVLYDPIPKALTLSTGTIYISTGLLSMLDTEGELAMLRRTRLPTSNCARPTCAFATNTLNWSWPKRRQKRKRSSPTWLPR